MIKIDTFSMALSKTYCYFISKLKYVFFLVFFIWSIFGPRKKCNLPVNIGEDFSYGT